jgi:hypothetical protein
MLAQVNKITEAQRLVEGRAFSPARAPKNSNFVIPSEARNPSSIETQITERFLGEKRASE